MFLFLSLSVSVSVLISVSISVSVSILISVSVSVSVSISVSVSVSVYFCSYCCLGLDFDFCPCLCHMPSRFYPLGPRCAARGLSPLTDCQSSRFEHLPHSARILSVPPARERGTKVTSPPDPTSIFGVSRFPLSVYDPQPFGTSSHSAPQAIWHHRTLSTINHSASPITQHHQTLGTTNHSAQVTPGMAARWRLVPTTSRGQRHSSGTACAANAAKQIVRTPT